MPPAYPYDLDQLFDAIHNGLAAVCNDGADDPRLRVEVLASSLERARSAVDMASRSGELIMGAHCAAAGALCQRLQLPSDDERATYVGAVASEIVRQAIEPPSKGVEATLEDLADAVFSGEDVHAAFIAAAAAFARAHLITP